MSKDMKSFLIRTSIHVEAVVCVETLEEAQKLSEGIVASLEDEAGAIIPEGVEGSPLVSFEASTFDGETTIEEEEEA